MIGSTSLSRSSVADSDVYCWDESHQDLLTSLTKAREEHAKILTTFEDYVKLNEEELGRERAKRIEHELELDRKQLQLRALQEALEAAEKLQESTQEAMSRRLETFDLITSQLDRQRLLISSLEMNKSETAGKMKVLTATAEEFREMYSSGRDVITRLLEEVRELKERAIPNLRLIIEDHAATIVRITDELNGKNSEIEKLKKELLAANQEIEELRGTVEELKSRVAALEIENTGLKDRVARLTTSLRDSENRNEEAEQRVVLLTRDLLEARRRETELTSKISDMELRRKLLARSNARLGLAGLGLGLVPVVGSLVPLTVAIVNSRELSKSPPKGVSKGASV